MEWKEGKRRQREEEGKERTEGGGGGASRVKQGRKHIPPPPSVKERNPADGDEGREKIWLWQEQERKLCSELVDK